MIPFDPLDAATIENPYPAYAQLREYEPAHFIEDDEVWAISRYSDVQKILRDPSAYSSAAMGRFITGGALQRLRARNRWADSLMALLTGGSAFVEREVQGRTVLHRIRGGSEGNRVLICTDPPVHTELRSLVNRSFTPRSIGRHMERIMILCNDLLDTFISEASTGSCDFIRSVASPFPVLVIAELLGVDGDRLVEFQKWSDEIVELVSGIGDVRADPEGFIAMFSYMVDLIGIRASDTRKADIISALLNPSEGVTAELNEFEIAAFAMLLLVAGNETTTSLLGNTLATLLHNPGQLVLLQSNASMMSAAIDESLRFESPFQSVYRVATRPSSVAGREFEEGDLLMLLIGSANRDDRQFTEADQYLINRRSTDHLAFSAGPHFCLGAYLAKLEGRIVINALLTRARDIELTDGVHWRSSQMLRGVGRLSVHVRPH